MVTVREEARKGPWTEQEDLQLASTARARAAASGGSTTSTLASSVGACLPMKSASSSSSMLGGKQVVQNSTAPARRTDNEIKNYWRTHMRKKAQEGKSNMSRSSSSSSLTYQSCHPEAPSITGIDEQELHGGSSSCITSILKGTPADMDGYPMDQIWMEMEAPEAASPTGLGFDQGKDDACGSLSGDLLPPSPVWDYYCPKPCWKMDDDINMALLLKPYILDQIT